MAPQEDIVIAVMGVTGAGKSNFIRKITGREDIVVGHSLESCTDQLATYQFPLDGHTITLVDTPGFNDTYNSDSEILSQITQWLESTYRANHKLTGLIYLHRIMDPRMAGSALRNLRMFQKLCGEQTMKNIVLTSTHWDVVGNDVAVARETELRETDGFWKSMINLGAQVARFNGDAECGRNIVRILHDKPPVALAVQTQLVDEGKPLPVTDAAIVVHDELAELRRIFEAEMAAERARAEAQRLAMEREAAENKRRIEAEAAAALAEAQRFQREKEEQMRALEREVQRQNEENERNALEEIARRIDLEQRKVVRSVENEVKRFARRFRF
ncbi:hypothetical protein RUND412_005089 [Rhizina undulata]